MRRYLPMTKNTSPEDDAFRVNYMIEKFPRPWRIESGKVKGRDTWVIVDSNGRRVYMSGRGALALVVASVNGFKA